MEIALLSFEQILAENLNSYRKSAETLGINLIEIEPTQLSLIVEERESRVLYQGKDFAPKIVIHRTIAKFADLLEPILLTLEVNGTVILNGIEQALTSRSKLQSALKFKSAGLPFLESQFLFEGESINIDLTGELIAKPVFGSQGKGIKFFQDSKEARAQLERTEKNLRERNVEPILLQRDLGENVRDIRAHVVNGKCIALMARTPQRGERLANLAQGGSGVPLSLDHPAAELAVRTANAFDLDFAGVDILGVGEKFYISEIDAWAGFAGIEKVCEVSVSKSILELAIAMAK